MARPYLSRWLLAGVALGTTGCLMAGTYHSARTLEKGTSSTGLNVSMTQYETTDKDTGKTSRVVLPDLIPELTYHLGVADDVEVGGRVALGSLGLSADVKWRFLHQGGLHLAVAPEVGVQGFVIVEGVSGRLPLLATIDLNDMFALTGAVFWSTTRWRPVDDTDTDFGIFNGTLGAAGAALGFELRGSTFVIRPMVELTSYVVDFDSSDPSFDRFYTAAITLHLGWIGGREKQQLDRMEQKIDRMSPPPAPPP